MRLHVNHKWPLLAGAALAAGLLSTTAVARHHQGPDVGPRSAMTASSANGPSADFPVTLGDSYAVGGIVFTPSDTMNLDAVGYASVGGDGAAMVSAAHHTMPIPSYAEVTSLDSGRTILVRVDRRGPMDATNLIELSPAAAAQLGLGGQRGAVRVRRVNPAEPERALLRAGAPAPERMPTPKALLAVLARKLDADGTVVLARTATLPPAAALAGAEPVTYAGPPSPPRPVPAMAGGSLARSPKAATSGTALPRLLAHGALASRRHVAATDPAVGLAPAPVPAKPAVPARKLAARPVAPEPAPAFGAALSGPGATYAGIGSDLARAAPPAPKPRLARAPAHPGAKPADIVAEAPAAQTGEAIRSGMLVVQAGAFAVKGNAQSVAARLGASVHNSGKVWRVRVGPFANRDQAEAALAKVHAAGYSEARIQRAE